MQYHEVNYLIREFLCTFEIKAIDIEVFVLRER